jgi:hypothetical protein
MSWMNRAVGAIELRYDVQVITTGEIVRFMEFRSSSKVGTTSFLKRQLLQHAETDWQSNEHRASLEGIS